MEVGMLLWLAGALNKKSSQEARDPFPRQAFTSARCLRSSERVLQAKPLDDFFFLGEESQRL